MACLLPPTTSRPKKLMQCKSRSWLPFIKFKHSTLGLTTNTALEPKIRTFTTLGSYCYLLVRLIKGRVDMTSSTALQFQM